VLERLREERADWQPVDTGTPRPGDRVNVEITPVREAGAEAAADPRPYELVLGKDQAIPDVEAAIQTLEPGADAEFEIEVPAGDDGDAGVEHQNVRIHLLGVQRAVLPTLDDEFARSVDEDIADLSALRERVQADLHAEAETGAEREVRRALIDQIVAANPFDVPDAMVRQYVNSMFRITEDADPERVRELHDVARPGAETSIRRMLVVERVAELNGLRATQEEIDARVEEIAARNERPVAEVWSSLQRSGRLNSLEDEITEGKVFDFLKSQSTIRGA
jgi:trigger factor